MDILVLKAPVFLIPLKFALQKKIIGFPPPPQKGFLFHILSCLPDRVSFNFLIWRSQHFVFTLRATF